MELEAFKNDINNQNISLQELTSVIQEVIQKEPTKIEIQKNILLSYVSDATGCGHIRNIFPMEYLNAIYGRSGSILPIVSPMFIWQEDILVRTKAILFQRQMSPGHYQNVLRYKQLQAQYGFKMVYDIDDFIWGHNELQGGTKEDGVPSYNFGWRGITEEIKEYSVKIMKEMDLITVTSIFLKDYINNVLNVNVPVEIVPNAIPMWFWGNTRKVDRKTPIVKPRVIYTGSPTHYSNQEKLLGDFDSEYKDFIIKNVIAGKIDFAVMGDCPFFFESIKDKITVIPWLNSYKYHLGVKGAKADIMIGPLVPNNFNYSKSYIKYQESCAAGIPFVGTVFSNNKPSPYDVCKLKTTEKVTVKELEDLIFGLCNDVNAYNKVVKSQYEWMDKTGGYLESTKFVNQLVKNYFE
jgi:hypothetical protein